MNLSLYDLSEEALALDDIAAMDDGEWTPEHEALAVELMEKLVVKAIETPEQIDALIEAAQQHAPRRSEFAEAMGGAVSAFRGLR